MRTYLESLNEYLIDMRDMMSDYLANIINQMKQESSDNAFVGFVESLENNDFGTNENQDYLKNLYPNIVKFYKNPVERDNED